MVYETRRLHSSSPDLSPSPFSQDLPGRDQSLNRFCPRLPLYSTFSIRSAIEILDTRTAQVCKIVAEFIQF